MDLELSDQFLYLAVTLTQGGKLPSGSGLAVWIHKHLVKLRYKPCPCYLFCLAQVEDGVDPLGGPGACGSSLHVQQDEQDIAALIWELGVPHTEVKGASKTGSVCDVQVPVELQHIYKGSLKGNGSLLNA